MTESSLYERLGGAFAIAAVVDHFSDAIVQQPDRRPASRRTRPSASGTPSNLGRLPGLKFMRTLWVCNVAGRAVPVHATVPGSTAARSRGGPPQAEDLARRVRRGRGRARADARRLQAFPRRRRARCWLHSPRTRTRSPRDTPASPAGTGTPRRRASRARRRRVVCVSPPRRRPAAASSPRPRPGRVRRCRA